MRIKKRSSCDSGKGWVPKCSSGFWVAITKKWIGEFVCLAVDTDGALCHRLEQRRLALRARPIDLVGEYDVREDRSGLEDEARRRAPVDHLGQPRPCDIARKQIARELDAAEVRIDRTCERASQCRLADPRNVLEQHVSARDQRRDGAGGDLRLPAKRTCDVMLEIARELGRLADAQLQNVVGLASPRCVRRVGRRTRIRSSR